MVPPSEHSLDVAEPCRPSSQVCGLEDWELGRSWPGQRKEEEVRRTLNYREGWGLEEILEEGPGGRYWGSYSSEPQSRHLCNGINPYFVSINE